MLDIFPPIIVFESCFNIIRDVIFDVLASCQVFSSVLGALHIESDSNIKVFKHIVHYDKVSLILLLTRVFPHHLVKAEKARYQSLWVLIDVLEILFEYASKLEEFSLRYLLDQIILVLRIIEERATFSR